MLREQREELWILAENKYPAKLGCSPASGSQTAPGFLLDLPHRSMAAASGVSELDFSAANLLNLLAVSVSSANLISNFLAIAVNCGSIVLKNPLTLASR
jgi:hypothetical protein